MATTDSWLQSAPVLKIRAFFLTKGQKCVHTCLTDHVMDVYDADFFKFRRRLFADGGLEKRARTIGLQEFGTNILYSNNEKSDSICDLRQKMFGNILVGKCKDSYLTEFFVECIETVVVRSLKEAASFRKRHQSDENVKDKEDSHSPFKRKPKEVNIPFSDESTLPLPCTSDVNLLPDDNICSKW